MSLQGSGEPVPVASLSPSTISVTLEAGNNTTELVTVHNTGTGTLAWNVDSIELGAAQPAPEAANVDPFGPAHVQGELIVGFANGAQGMDVIAQNHNMQFVRSLTSARTWHQRRRL